MSREERIACFQDTLALCAGEKLADETARARENSRIYPENFRSERLHAVREPEIEVVEADSFAAAQENLKYGRVAVLNFANPHYPGGGVFQGARAQEECLCRSSNLYPCLEDGRVFEEFYRYHQKQTDYDFSDRLIYTPGITVFKDDQAVPKLLKEQAWFRVDVITCAAPYLAKRRYVNRTVLGNLFRNRIRNILEAAVENEAEVLILGAFGCGAFKNPPEVVAGAFRQVLSEHRYQAFRRVVFAIKSSVGGDPYTVCPNLAAFQTEFLGSSKELEKLRYVGGAQDAPGMLDVVMPGGRIRYRGSEARAYYEWREKNPYFGKRFSILSDSAGTLEGFNPRGSRVFYDAERREKTGVWEMGDTWWGKVIDFFGGELLVNDSGGGSRVTRPADQKEPLIAGCSQSRTGRLHEDAVQPDVILVYLGWNDWAYGVKPEPEGPEEGDTCFSLAYSLMLSRLKKNYPQAEIWCCTMPKSSVASDPDMVFPESYGGVNIREYNHQIVNAALAAGVCVADLAAQEIPFDSLDGSHPTARGMDTLAMLMIRQMALEDGGEMLDCEMEHEIVRDVCVRCGKPMPAPRDNVLRLKLRDSGRELAVSGWQMTLGRSRECDLVVDNPYVARSQATFTCREGKWRIRDNGTKNGTYLNGKRLEADGEYRIYPGDVLCFAQKVEAEVLP